MTSPWTIDFPLSLTHFLYLIAVTFTFVEVLCLMLKLSLARDCSDKEEPCCPSMMEIVDGPDLDIGPNPTMEDIYLSDDWTDHETISYNSPIYESCSLTNSSMMQSPNRPKLKLP